MDTKDILQRCQDRLSVIRPTLSSDNVSSPTSYGSSYKDRSFLEKLNQACLSGISWLPGSDRTGFYIFHQAEDSGLNRRYLQYLLSPESPWRDLVKAQPRQELDFVFKNGLVLTDFNFPTNFFVNFLTAFRLSYEKPHALKFWEKLLEGGVRPGTALMFTSCCSWFNSPESFGWTNDTGHNAFSLQQADLESARRVNNGEPCLKMFSQQNFQVSSDYSPCNTVWSGQPLVNFKKHHGELFSELQKFLQTGGKIEPERKRMFFNNQEEKVTWRSPTFSELKDFMLYLDKEYP